jgi:bifunctional DNase/RNase
MVEMELVGVRVELPSNTPIVLLRETAGQHRVLPIFIGGPEATAIAFALEEVETPRPMTHDLIKDLLDEVGANIERVVVTELREATFYAEIILTVAGQVHSVSARPSDAVAMAVRYGAPVFAEEGVLEVAGRTSEGGVPEEVVEQFKEFIDQVNPEDFAS